MKSFISILILFLLGCGQTTQEKIIAKPDAVSVDRILSQDKKADHVSNDPDDHPFTNNPVLVRLKNNKIQIDSLSPYFKYKDIENLDQICTIMNETNDLPTVIFSTKAIKTKHNVDTVFLADCQFLVGNLKTTHGVPNIILFMNYTEGWGEELFIVSVDTNYEILDIEFLCASGGDGGDFNDTGIKKISNLKYNYTTKSGYQTFTEPTDTIIYDKTTGQININYDGTFTKNIIRTDKGLIEVIKTQ